MQRISDAFWSAAIYLFMGLFGLVVLVLTLLATPFFLLFYGVKFLFPPSADAMDAFHSVHEAFVKADITFLEDLAASEPEFPNGTDSFIQRSWLVNAVDTGNPTSVAWVLEKGIDDINGHDDEGRSALTSAIDSNNADEIVALLINHGADINAKGTLDVTPLHIAAARGSIEVVQLLLDHGADPLARDSDYDTERPIDWIGDKKRPKVRALLLEAMEQASP